MSFVEHVPEYVITLEKEITALSGKRSDINWGHECDCEYCDREGEDADPDAEIKDEKIERQIRDRQQMIKRLENYEKLVKAYD